MCALCAHSGLYKLNTSSFWDKAMSRHQHGPPEQAATAERGCKHVMPAHGCRALALLVGGWATSLVRISCIHCIVCSKICSNYIEQHFWGVLVICVVSWDHHPIEHQKTRPTECRSKWPRHQNFNMPGNDSAGHLREALPGMHYKVQCQQISSF